MPLSNRHLILYFALAAVIAIAITSGIRPRTVAAAGFSGFGGPVSIHRMGGDIDVPNAPDGAELATMGGNIHVGSASFVKAKTMGGTIAVDAATGAVDVSTMGGTITILQAGGRIHASTMAGDVSARLTGPSAGVREISLSSMSGKIVLAVPKDYGMNVRIKLAYTKKSSQNFRIIQDLGLDQRESDEWDTHQGSPRKYIIAQGRVGDGKNPVTIETINGDVVVKQE